MKCISTICTGMETCKKTTMDTTSFQNIGMILGIGRGIRRRERERGFKPRVHMRIVKTT